MWASAAAEIAWTKADSRDSGRSGNSSILLRALLMVPRVALVLDKHYVTHVSISTKFNRIHFNRYDLIEKKLPILHFGRYLARFRFKIVDASLEKHNKESNFKHIRVITVFRNTIHF